MTNYNPLYSTNFKFTLYDAPNLDYFIQSIQFPAVSAMGVTVPYKQLNFYFQADRIEYDPLQFQFIVDENFDNYLYLYNWLLSCITTERPIDLQKDGSLLILTNKRAENITVKFVGLFPQTLSSLDFQSNVGDTEVITCNVSFRFQMFVIER